VNPQTDRIFNKRLHYFAVLTAVVAVGLIVAGATVTSTGSGDAVPDWPLSYGTLTPPMTGGILYEHTHRIVAGLTGFLIAILAIWLWIKEPRRWVRWLGTVTLLAVVVQAVLGGLRVLVVSTDAVQDAAAQITGAIEPARIAIAVTHAFLAQSILCLLFAIALFTSRSWLSGKDEISHIRMDTKYRSLAIVMVGAVFLQLILGALVRHTGAGLIIPDFPLSFGRIIPPFGDLPYNPNAPFPMTPGEIGFKVALHFSHRVVALAILGLVSFLFVVYRKAAPFDKLAWMLLFLTIIQIILGAFNIWTAKSVYSTVPHVVIGALILGTGVMFVSWNWRFRRITEV
jgi:cytochrome c oxidase assembly protein subunit 15